MPANQSTPEVTRAPVRIALEDVTPTIAAAFGDDLCLIWSGEWQAYWRAGGNGYTKDVAQAGWYTIQAAYARTCHCDPSKQIAFERPDATPARGGDELREEITQAIARADAAFGYAYRMTKMDETGEEHTLFMDGFEPAVFEEREDGYPVIEQRRNTLRADAILAALASTDMAGAEDEWGKRLDWDGNAQVAQDAYDTLTAPPVEGLTSGEEVRSCPACSGDCGSANPPVIFCPMRDAAPDAPTREKKASDKEGGDDGNVDARNGDRAGVCQPDAVADGHGQPRSVATQRVGLTSGEGDKR